MFEIDDNVIKEPLSSVRSRQFNKNIKHAHKKNERPIDTKILLELISNGKTSYEMATILNCAQSHIIRSLNKIDIKLKRPSAKKICLNCRNIFTRSVGKFCSSKCSAKFNSDSSLENWLSGKTPGWCGETRQLKVIVRKYILQRDNYTCTECGWNKVHPVDGKPLVEVDHTDGDAENCTPENLKTLCPNCHSMTPTFRARNKNSKRNRKPR